tara:strand:- start:307 stop:411 length:105 start_codon:yes stop_codon:yes gene_type:complete
MEVIFFHPDLNVLPQLQAKGVILEEEINHEVLLA